MQRFKCENLEYNRMEGICNHVIKINQSITVYRKNKKVPAKVKAVANNMIDVTANGKIFTCHFYAGKWRINS